MLRKSLYCIKYFNDILRKGTSELWIYPICNPKYKSVFLNTSFNGI